MDDLIYSDRLQTPSLSGQAAPFDASGDSETVTSSKENYEAKRQHGVYYTPSDVADLLAKWAIRSKHDSVLEPSFGGCSFLEASLTRLQTLGCEAPAKQLSGFDVDPRAFVHLAKLDKRLCDLGNRFVQGDFLTANCDERVGKFSAITANPPFVPYRRMNAAQRRVIEEWSRKNTCVTPKDASLWAYFLQHALQFLKPDARMAWILPSSLLFVEYGQSLKDLVQRHFEKTLLIDLQEQLFIDAGTRERTVLLFAENFSTSPLTSGVLTTLKFSRFKEVSNYFESVDTNTDGASLAGERNEPFGRSAELIADVLACTPHISLGDISNIRIGDVVGDTSFFVKSRSAWRSLGISEKDLRPLLAKSSHLKGLRATETLVEKLIASDARFLLLHPRSGQLVAGAKTYLENYPEEKRKSNATFSRRTTWYLSTYDDTADLFFPSLSTVGPRFIVNSSKLACTNSLYKIHLNEDWYFARFAIAIFGMTSFMQLTSELVGGAMGEGALKLNPSHVKQLPIFSCLYDRQQNHYEVFLQVDGFVSQGDWETARLVADRWLAPVIGKEVLLEMNLALDEIRKQRRDYRSEH